jgi:NAD(P)-dependent dehydrogenase (short-subunit alcohol dehydrogenase family)
MKRKTIAISGGLGRLGFDLAIELSKKKFNIIIGDSNLKKYRTLKKEIISNNIKFFNGNLCKAKEIEKFIKFGIKYFRKIDYTIHCLYPKNKSWDDDFLNLKQSSLEENISNHLGGSIIYSQKFIKHFLKNKKGKIILISSILGISAPKFEHYRGLGMNSPIAYSAIKSGIISITKYLAKYYGNKNIQVNCMSPGGILDNQHKIFVSRYKKSCLTKGLLNSKDLYSSINFLLSEDSNFINGQNLVVDDGWSL